MNFNLNEMRLAGHLARDPQYHEGSEGTDPRTTATLAVNRPGKDTGVDYFFLVAWGDKAKVLAKYGKKGKGMYVSGSGRTRSTKREDGSWDNRFEVVLDKITLLDDPQEEKKEQEQQEEDPSSKSAIMEKVAELVTEQVINLLKNKGEKKEDNTLVA